MQRASGGSGAGVRASGVGQQASGVGRGDPAFPWKRRGLSAEGHLPT